MNAMQAWENEPTGAAGSRPQLRRAKPVIKYVGGKRRLLPELLARVPRRFERYYEPFVGGGALFFALAPEHAAIGDVNADLVAMYGAIEDNVEEVIDLLEGHACQHGERHYNEVRDSWNLNAPMVRTPSGRAAAFIYLNKACFNGLWRVNKAGAFNVGWGKHATFEPDVDNLRAASAALARAELRSEDFRITTAGAERGDFVYLDPPYDDTFGAYTTGGFTGIDQAGVAFTARKLVERGVQVMISNADTPRIRALYAGMRIDRVERPGTMNSNGKKRGAVPEVIITAGYEAPAGAELEARIAAWKEAA